MYSGEDACEVFDSEVRQLEGVGGKACCFGGGCWVPPYVSWVCFGDWADDGMRFGV